MARRLAPAARRSEIIDVAQEVIATEGFRGLSLREIARRCDMSAPGLMRYFPDTIALLEAVLDRRDETDLSAILSETRDDESLLGLLDAARAYYGEHADEATAFDALEAEALDPHHPAHPYFVARSERTFDRMRPAIMREYVDGENVARLLKLLLEALRHKTLQASPGVVDDVDADWQAIRTWLSRAPRRG